MTHFAFLDAEWPDLSAEAKKAETAAHADPRTSCFYARRTLELAVAWLYRSDRTLKPPYDDNLSSLLHAPEFKTLVGQPLLTKAKLIKDLGNRAVHSQRPVPAADAINAVREVFHLTFWLARTYGRKDRPEPGLTFNPANLPKAATATVHTAAQLQAMQAALDDKDKQLKDAQGKSATLDEQLGALRAEIAKIRAANQSQADTHDYNEAETRDAFIDLLLNEAGWTLSKPEDREFPVKGMPNNTGDGFVDYVLWGDDGKPLGLVEAKRTKRDAHQGKQQAKLYADCLEKKFGQRPVIFYTNGYENWIWDDASYPPRQIQGFYKKDELLLMIQRRTTRQKLSGTAINETIVERYYQTRAIRRIGEAFEKDHDRKTLIVMATGAGKTRTVIALVDQLMRANWIKRVLFLADRVALVNQTVKAFKAFLSTVPPVNLVTEKDTDGRVFVSTYQSMMGLINQKETARRFGVGHFDLVIIDEAHRSVYQKYGAIFSYFDSLLIGLTATPKAEIDRNTYRLFELQDGVPTDAYGLDEAVGDGYLVPPKSFSVPTKFVREGIKYNNLSEDEKDQWDSIEWNDDGTIPDVVGATELNKYLFNKDTVDKVLETLMTKGVKVAGGDRLGKTIIFAKNHDHAVFIGERFDANYPHHKGHFARVIDFQTEYAQSLIDDFSNAQKAPHIAISVDMLDTGIDIPEVVNLVFFKLVRSKTKFWQMVGRGTRLSPELFGPGHHKEFFAIFDFCQNLEYFSQNIEAAEASAGASLAKRLFLARLGLIAEIDKHNPTTPTGMSENPAPYVHGPMAGPGPLPSNDQELREALAQRLRDEVDGMNLDNFVIRPKRKYVEIYREADAWKSLSLEDRHALAEHLAGLPSPVAEDEEDEEDEEEAKRLDYLILRLQLARLNSDPAFLKLSETVREIASALEAQSTIPMIRDVLPFILEIQTDEFWQDITLPMLEKVRRLLRALVKLIEKSRRRIIYSDFEDELGDLTEIVLPGVTVGMDFERFKAKARHFLKAHKDHLAIQRLRRNQPLTSTDLTELEGMLATAAGEASEHLTKVNEFGLCKFVRSLVGLDRAAAKEAFSTFLTARTMSAAQIEFVDMIINHLTENGVMEPARLYESPFTDQNPKGVEGLFSSQEIVDLVGVIQSLNQQAA